MFTIRKSEKFATVQELGDYQKTMEDVKRMMEFHGKKFDEKQWLTNIIQNADNKCKDLVEAYSVNSAVMSYNEVETWKRIYNEYSLARNLHMRVFWVRFGEDFILN